MVVGGEGRNDAPEDGPLRDPSLEDDPRVVSAITTAGVVEEERLRVFEEVHQEQVYDPKREGLFDADDVLLFEHVSADVAFEPPPELAAWLLETETSQQSDPPVDEGQARALRPPLFPSLAFLATLLTAAGLSLRVLSRKRARARREKLSPVLGRPESGYKACAGDPAGDPEMSRGLPRDGKVKVEAQLAFVRGIMAKGLGNHEKLPHRVLLEDVLKPVAEYLSQRLARLERAENELEMMVEVKPVLDRLDAGDLFCEDQARGGFPPADDGALGRRTGEGGDSDADDGDGDGGGVEQPPDLAKRVRELLDAETADDIGEARRSLCVFYDELDRCCAVLEEKKVLATGTLEEGLERWDLEKVDGAMTELQLLGFSDLVAEFRANRLVVRGKIERLRNELKEPQGSRGTKEYVPSLLRACVKAETFSATGLPEYKTAKCALEDARTNQLITQARQTFAAHMATADPRLVERLVDSLNSSRALTLLPRDLQADFFESECGAVSSVDVGSACGGEWPACGAEGGVEHLSSNRGEGRNDDVRGRGKACAESAFSRGSPFVEVGGGVDTPSGTIETHRPTRLANRMAAESVREQMLSLRAGYQSAAVEINALQIRLDERHEDECSRIRSDLEEKERKETSDNVCSAQNKAANIIQERMLEISQRVLKATEKENKRIKSEKDRTRLKNEQQKVDDRRRSLRSADNDFFRLLGLTSAVLTAAIVAAQKGVSLSSSTLLDVVWRIVTAECREGGGNGGTLACDPTSATCDLPCSGASSGYGDSCPVGSGDAVACSDGGYLGCVAGADTFFWWAVSAAGSATGAVTKAGGSAFGWLLGEALGLVIPFEQCEVYAVISLAMWLCSLVGVMRVTGLVAGEVRGPVGAAVRSTVFALWVWGRFHGWLLATSWEVLLLVAPAPALVLAYAGALRWFELKPESCWQMGEYDARPVVSRVLPAVVACTFALFLGAQAS